MNHEHEAPVVPYHMFESDDTDRGIKNLKALVMTGLVAVGVMGAGLFISKIDDKRIADLRSDDIEMTYDRDKGYSKEAARTESYAREKANFIISDPEVDEIYKTEARKYLAKWDTNGIAPDEVVPIVRTYRK